MAFKKETPKDYFLLDTQVENMFINEYMASAPGEHVKVYLFARMYATLDKEITNEEIAKYLSLEHEDVLQAWTYWEKLGVIKKSIPNPEDKLNYDVVFLSLKEQLYGDREGDIPFIDEQGSVASMSDENIKKMFEKIEKSKGQIVSGTEMMEVVSWLNDFHATPEMIVYGYQYCAKKRKKNINYVGAVIRNWVELGLLDVEKIEKYLSENDKRQHLYTRILKALGFMRNITEEEKKIVDTWFDEMKFPLEKVLEACAKTTGISNPNINYVNKVLTNWHDEKPGKDSLGKSKELSVGDIMRYYDEIRRQAERVSDEHREEVYQKVYRIKEIDEELRKRNRELSKVVISDVIDKKDIVDKIKKKTEELNNEKAFLLTDNGYELGYMDISYKCEKCKDTGMLETGERCQCFGEISREKIDQVMTNKK